MIAAIVPAAGLSSRMGQNKLLLPYDGLTLIEHAVNTLIASDIQEIVVVLGYQADQIRHLLWKKKVNLVENLDYRKGLSSSIRIGMGAVSDGATAMMVHLADQPLLEPGEINLIIRAFSEAKQAGKNIVVPFFGTLRGNPVVLDASYRQMVLDLAGDEGCRRIIKKHPEQVFVVFMETDHVVRDIDTLEDLEMLRSFGA
jgi:molybdenum cofactor cytidylyltransferase